MSSWILWSSGREKNGHFFPCKKVRLLIPTTQRSLIRICENARPKCIAWYWAIGGHLHDGRSKLQRTLRKKMLEMCFSVIAFSIMWWERFLSTPWSSHGWIPWLSWFYFHKIARGPDGPKGWNKDACEILQVRALWATQGTWENVDSWSRRRPGTLGARLVLDGWWTAELRVNFPRGLGGGWIG